MGDIDDPEKYTKAFVIKIKEPIVHCDTYSHLNKYVECIRGQSCTKVYILSLLAQGTNQ
jgi:hypothetical protein